MRTTANAAHASTTSEPTTREFQAYAQLVRTGEHDSLAHVMLLGLVVLELPRLLAILEAGLPFRAFERLAKNTAIPTERLLRLIDVPRRTLLRRRTEGRFSRDESDRLVRAARIFGAALSLFEGDRDAALVWLEEPQPAFGGAIPLEMARSEVGAKEVEDLAYRLEQGVFS
ncbi:MAG: type II RES/Xre toxin-antitoxin system antitoxin [Thermoanaerobaculia bacterium]